MARMKIVAALVVALLTSGCGYTGAMTETMAMKNSGNGQSFSLGQVRAEAAILVAHSDGSASLSMSLINPTADAVSLVGVNIDGVAAQISPATALVPANGVLRIGFDSGYFVDVVKPLTVGSLVRVGIALSDGSVGGTSVLVAADTGEYAGVVRGPLPSASPSTSASPQS